ncbi:MAG TPA: phosphoenolpyruvate--protein phosphotransferase [Pirellulales bacterium]|jgi:phosphotransferase system enzyme I (PtsI)|nr:phosphoenolpyruvate--protein phosphotransferase [Pirellulales bacterium]
MQKLQGIAVSPGIAIGEALVVDQEGFRIPRRFVARDAVDHELARLAGAMDAAGAEIEHNRDQVREELGAQYGAIFSAHLEMLRDPRLRTELDTMIRERHYSPEYAVSRVLRRYIKVFQSLDRGFLNERANDIFDIEKRLLRNLLGRRREELSEIVSPVIVLAHNLTPSETANLSPEFVVGFATEVGGPGSHTAIVAEALEIPAVIGTGLFLSDVSGGDPIIIDGDQGLVILQPDEETIARYRHEVEEHRNRAARLKSLRDLPAVTADGQHVALYGNIEFPSEVNHCLDRGAEGIGLYRTEFLYLGAGSEPDEETHYNAYLQVVQAMAGRPVVIRTLDMGADKVLPNFDSSGQRNPCLGLRSIRLSLGNLPLFRTQLRAILRASALGDVRIMFPLISTLLELRQAKMCLADVMEDLEEQQIPFNRDLLVGMMVEVPAAVLMIDRFVEEVDFLSIGTNDLIQYTLAVDRANKEVASLYNACDPAILRLLKTAIDTGLEHGIPVNVCGQMSGSTTYTMLLLGLGLRGFSVPPSAVPEIKKVCRSVNIPQCVAVANRVMTMEHARDIKNYLRDELKKALPDLTG